MTDTLAVTQAISLAPGVQMTPTGAIISEDVTLEGFCQALQNCQTLANASLWALGDLLLYGEARGDWGEMYTQAIDLTRKSYTTLTHAVHLSKRYPPEDRIHELSWTHHREAAKIPDHDERQAVLRQAVEQQWTREQLRDHIRGDQPAPPLRTTCPQCGYVWT
jgi:hypothetical protein